MLHLQPLISLITAAVECSIYLAPDAPGLTYQELIELQSGLGHQEGEISDALISPLAHLEARSGRYLPNTVLMSIYYQFHHVEELDYRPVRAVNFVHGQLHELAKAVGARNARIERAVLAERATQNGIARIEFDAAITLAILCEIMVVQNGAVSFAPGRENYPSPEQQRSQIQSQSAMGVMRKPNRGRAYPIVKDIVARRTDGRPKHAEPFEAFADQLTALGYGHFRLWWAQTSAELKSASSENRPLSVCVYLQPLCLRVRWLLS